MTDRPITAFFTSTSPKKRKAADFTPAPKRVKVDYKLTLVPRRYDRPKQKVNLCLFRNDLRVQDNPALSAASNTNANVIALYFWSPETWRRHNIGAVKIDFIRRSLIDLSHRLWQWRIPLLIRHNSNTSDLMSTLKSVVEEHGVEQIYFNTEYEVNESLRDEKISKEFGSRAHLFHDQCVVPPSKIPSHIVVYNQMKNRWMDIVQKGEYLTCAALPFCNEWTGWYPEPDVIPDAPSVSSDIPSLWPAGEQEAHGRLELYVEGEISQYMTDRNSPSKDITSKLSPYLAIGTISARHCINRALAALNKPISEVALFGGRTGRWISEIIWRDFYRFIMYNHPRICKYKPFQSYAERIVWRDAPDEFDAWKKGETGYPIIDAAMRQLLKTGWMHNRVRMLVASFLSKHLLIDWKLGEAWFSRHLIDADLASNNGGWQWSASTGVDGHQWIRVMNPILQSEKVDPEGVYIRQFVPELASCDAKTVHDPSRRGAAYVKSIGYHMPIVEHKFARSRALEAYKLASSES